MLLEIALLASSVNLAGSYTLYEEGHHDKVSGHFTISGGGRHFTIFGDTWSGSGVLMGNRGHYDWFVAGGKHGQTSFTVDLDGTLHGTVRGGENWSYVGYRDDGDLENGGIVGGVVGGVPMDPVPDPNRDTSTVKKAMLGHWRTADTFSDFYFGPKTVIMVDKGSRTDLLYDVKTFNDKKGTMEMTLTVAGESGEGLLRKVAFRPGRTIADESVWIGDDHIDTEWDYVDAKQKP